MTLSIIALIIAIIALLIASFTLSLTLKIQGRLSMRPTLTHGSPEAYDTGSSRIQTRPHQQPWVIYNPIKIKDKNAYTDEQDFKERVSKAARNAGFEQPHFIATTEEEPGDLQTKQALQNNADLVLCAGGDGTMRRVAGALRNSNVPLGIIPLGTGNLLARNLGLPIDFQDQSLELCFTGRLRKVDLGLLKIDDSTEEHPFVVMAGLGFDGDIMAKTNAQLKDSIGYFAYFWAAIKELHRPSMLVNLRVGDAEKEHDLRARTILFANCGELTGKLPLLPNADPSDGWLDITRIDVKAGLLGWMEVASKVMIRAIGVRSRVPEMTSSLAVTRARKAQVTADRPRHVQLDGDPVGKAERIEVRTIPGALLIRC